MPEQFIVKQIQDREISIGSQKLRCDGISVSLDMPWKISATKSAKRGQDEASGSDLWSTVCTYVDLHLSVQAIVQDEVMGHSDAMRLHGVPRPVVVVSDLICDRRHEWVCEVREVSGSV
jgi:hypothetical protein